MEESKPEEENIINTKEEEEKKESNPCYFCKTIYEESDKFSCEHNICPKCLFRKIFINNIKEINNIKNNIIIKCKCGKGTLNKTIDEIYQINNKKNKIYEELYSDDHIKNEINTEPICLLHQEKIKNFYCVNCAEDMCEECIKNDSEKEHKIFEKEYLTKYLKKEIKEIKMNYTSKEKFEEKYKEICDKLKEGTQLKLNELLIKIEETAKALLDFKKKYEEIFKNELINAVKILKLYKLFYLNYYFDKSLYEESTDINFLRYINSISNEISSIEIAKSENIIKELENIKHSINIINIGDIDIIKKINYTKIVKGYKIEQIIEKSHDKLLNGIFEIDNKKIMTGSLDFTLKIWEEKNNKFENIKTIKGQCGAVCSMTKLSDGNIITTAANNNNINIWGKQGDSNYIIVQSLSSHEKAVLTIAQLDNGKLISGGMDNLIIVWDKDQFGSYIEKQRIKDKKPIIKILSLSNNKFAFTSDNRIRIMIQKEIKKEKKNNDMINEIFDDLEIEQNELNENPYIVCYKLTKHVGRVRCMIQLKNGYLVSGGGEMSSKKDSTIIIWKPNDLDGFYYSQTLTGHKTDINGLIELKDGRIASSSKDRTIRIWKNSVKDDKDNIHYQIDEILNEHKHGIYCIAQISDGRILTSTSEGAIVVWKDHKFLTFW